MEDHRISAKSIAEQLSISRERVGSIIREDLDTLVAFLLRGRAKDLSVPLYMNAFSVIDLVLSVSTAREKLVDILNRNLQNTKLSHGVGSPPPRMDNYFASQL